MRAISELCELIKGRTGISLRDARDMGSLERFVKARLEALGLSRVEEYLALMSRPTTPGLELGHLITAVTNPHTYFFRDVAQFQAARSLLKAARDHGLRRPFRVWSAGCATGEEPFTIAMIALDLGVDVEIVATDINEEVLAFAREGRYKAWSLRRSPPEHVERFFDQEDEESYRVCQDVRDLVTFRRHNLVTESFLTPAGGGWDWIFCRNVLLYFDRELTLQIIERFARVLETQGWLFLSTAEHLHGLETPFRIVTIKNSFAYRLAEEVADEREATRYLGEASESFEWTFPPEITRREVRAALAPKAQDQRSPLTPVPLFEDPPQQEEPRQVDLYLQALEEIDRGHLARARGLITRHLDRRPEDHVAWITRGNLCLRLHDFEDALAAYERARERDPLLAEIHYLQGVVYRKLGDLTRAIHALRHALFLEPDHWGASFLLAGLYDRIGDGAQHRRNLAYTLKLLEAGAPLPTFLSCVAGMQDVRLEPSEARRLCRRYLTDSGLHAS